MRAFQRASDRAGRFLLSPLSLAQHQHRHYVTRPSFVRPFTGTVSADDRCISNGGAPSPLHRQLVHADDRCFNTSGFGSWNAGSIHGVRRRMSLSVSGEPTTKSDQPLYFEGPWYEKYLLLKEYKKEHGNCLAPARFVYNDVKLGQWVKDQRRLYKKGTLSTNRREMLDALGFSWDPKGDAWERNFALLEQFRKREGHCNAPQSHKEDGASLGSWLSNQRTAMKQGRLDESYQGRLDKLGVSWDPLADQWEQNFALLEQFKEREGHCDVPKSHEEDGIKLGFWLSNQRQGKGKMEESLQRRLEQLGVSWNPQADEWEQKFALLEKFKEREGHCNVSKTHEEDGINLGTWLHTMRQVRKGNREGNLNLERIERLDEVGIRW